MALLFWGWYAVGLLLMLFFRVPEALGFANGLFLLLYALYAISLRLPSASGSRLLRIAPALLAIALLAFGVEWLGTTTGMPFGAYVYTATLGIGLFGVPAAVAAAWVGVVVNTSLLIPRGVSRPLRALTIGALATGLDLVLDPVAHARGLWRWDETAGLYGVPWTNFASWFAVGALLSLLLPQLDATEWQRRRAWRLYQGMLLMFGLLAVKEALWASAAIAAIALLAAERSLRHDRSAQAPRL
ncbi:carotenoid biosynthesis protein [Paenibacillus athensensis]|uniref:Carotenoid biosynthesis protein n=2 Tax=Paenibacillus athensensis TaxID=1967502 RepID=A0A4Y8Q244_9BACL|nr:carotenoid biosynthesis protein [Paenibacillus athensensis]